jgi:hypothetical protein
MPGYDVIGDIHGHADALIRLLEAMDYALRDGVYSHPTRTVVFAGDFVDRGPRQREVLSILRAMVEAGSARAVMGNHEFNAIAYATLDGKGGGFLRPRTPKNHAQHRAFLGQIGDGSDAHAEAIAWFATLPFTLAPRVSTSVSQMRAFSPRTAGPARRTCEPRTWSGCQHGLRRVVRNIRTAQVDAGIVKVILRSPNV